VLPGSDYLILTHHVLDLTPQRPRSGEMTRTSHAACAVRRSSAGFVLKFGLVLACASWFGAGSAQKLVDPNTVAPEYREAAEKRRAEQLGLLACAKKADEAKVPRRDRTEYITHCADK
jgi:hypothetical protein